jgi:hypothetical protein
MQMLVGPHAVRIEEDLLFVQAGGDFTMEQVMQLTGLADELIARFGAYYSLVDMDRMGKVPPEVRRWVAEWSRGSRVEASAFFGGSVATRALMTLLMHAITLVKKKRKALLFAKTEQEARAWLVQQRLAREANAPPRASR